MRSAKHECRRGEGEGRGGEGRGRYKGIVIKFCQVYLRIPTRDHMIHPGIT